MPDESTDQASEDAAAKAAGEVNAAKQEAATARAEAAAAKTESENMKAEAAERRAKEADDRVAQAAADAAASAAGQGGGDKKVFDEDYVKKLRSEAAAHRVAAQEAQQKLKEREDAEKSENERATERAANADKRAAEADRKLLRIEVAIKKKLPLEMADRLVGDTKDDLEKDAEKLLKVVAPTAGQGFDQGARGEGGSGKQKSQDWIRKAFLDKN